MSIRQNLSDILEKIRNPEIDENEKKYQQDLNFKRLIILAPFIIAALIFLLQSL